MAKVGPAPDRNSDVIEIRPNRHLRIRHLNPRQRDERFEREMQMFVEYRRHGMVPHVLNAVKARPHERAKSPGKVVESHHINNIQNVPGVLISGDEHDQTQESYIEQTGNSHQGTIPDIVKDAESIVRRGKDVEDKNSIAVNPETSLPPSRSSNRVPSVQSVSQVHVNVTDGQLKRPLTHPVIEEKDEPSTPRISQDSQNVRHDLSISELSGRSKLNTEVAFEKNNSTRKLNSVLFFFHGVGGSSNIWVSQLKYFSNLGYEIICPDLIGHGLSCAPDDRKAYHFDEILEDIEELFDRYCKKDNIIIGHSYGCTFAVVMARKRARRVSKLILVSGGAPIPLAPQPGVFTLPLCCLNCLKPCISCTFRRNAFHKKSSLPVPTKNAFDIPSYVLSYIMNGQEWPDGDEVYHNWITVATLLIYGEQDKWIGLEDEEDMLNAIYGSQLEVIDNAGHMVMIEAADRFNEILQQFVEDIYSESDEATNQNDKKDHVTVAEDNIFASDASVREMSEAGQLSHRSKGSNEVNGDLSARARTPSTRPRATSVVSEISYKSGKSARSTKSMPRGVLSHHSHHNHHVHRMNNS